MRLILSLKEEEHAIFVRCSGHPCTRLAYFDVPMVPRCGKVRSTITITGVDRSESMDSPPGKPYTSHRLLLGTHTSGQGKEYLQIATLQLPKNEADAAERDVLSRDQYDDDKGGVWRALSSLCYRALIPVLPQKWGHITHPIIKLASRSRRR